MKRETEPFVAGPLAIITLLIIAILVLNGCGTGHAGTTHSASPSFPPQQALKCSGTYETGMLCDQSDGSTFYRHDQFTVSTRPDGHGTFEIMTETGMTKGGLYQLEWHFPTVINITEIHGTANYASWCKGNGILSTWEAYDGGTQSHVVGGKTYQFNAGETANFVIPQVLFPAALPTEKLNQNIYIDLCASGTVNWMLYGSF